MKLTNTDRNAFIRAVMDDVPVEDFRQQAHDLAQRHFVSTMPAKLRAVYNDKKLRDRLKAEHVSVGKLWGYFYGGHEKVPPSLLADVSALMDKQRQQDERLKELRNTLTGTVNGITTRKRLIEVLPEFAKYAPADIAVTPNLPVVANVVTAFVRAGWPKQPEQRKQTARGAA